MSPAAALWAATLVSPSGQSLEPARYASTASAREAWTANGGGLPVESDAEGVRLPFKISGKENRAYWDLKLKKDLSRVDRFTFSLYITDPTQAASVANVYFRSGEGWYSGVFSAEKGWNQISISKSSFGVEGSPAGWKNVDTMRIGVWKSVEGASSLIFRDLKAETSQVVVVQGNRTPTDSGEFGTVVSQAKTLTSILQGAGMEPGGLTDTDVEEGALEGRSFAFFPYNPNASDKEIDQIEAFLKKGGKAFAFFWAPTRLLNLLGVESAEYMPPAKAGQFSGLLRTGSGPSAQPSKLAQASWNIFRPKLAPGGKVAYEWIDSDGKSTGLPAIVSSPNGYFMSHVLLPDDLTRKHALLQSLVFTEIPALGEAAYRKSASTSERVGPFSAMAELQKQVGAEALKPALTLRAESQALADKGSWLEAIDRLQRMREAMSSAYCASLPPKKGDRRAAWCHSAFGVDGLTWEQTAAKMEAGGMNMVFPNMLWGGIAYYPSKVLPVSPEVAARGDQIKECLAAARRHKLQVHVWKVNWNLQGAPKDHLAMLRAAGRTQKNPQGQDIDWLCPSHPENYQTELNAMVEVARNYAVDGIHFDYIRYPSQEGCYCDGCRKRFEDREGVKVANWPTDVISGDLTGKYLDFRRSNISRLVKAVSEEARKVHPGIKISAAVFADWPGCRDSIGQDWVAWLKNGWLDFACPMTYTTSATQYEQWLAIQSQALGGADRLCPGVGVSLEELLPPDQTARQIMISRKAGSSGFILFNLDSNLLNSVLPKLRLGITKE